MSVIISISIGIAILFIAFFAGIEVAFATANRLSIELKKKQGSCQRHTSFQVIR